MNRPRLYIDSCDFIEAIKNSEGVPTDPTRANDIWYIRRCLEASRAGEIEVITSMLTIAEVRRAGNAPTDRVKRVIRSVLTSGKIVTLAEMTQGIAEKARDLHWEHGVNLGVLTLSTLLRLSLQDVRSSLLAMPAGKAHTLIKPK